VIRDQRDQRSTQIGSPIEAIQDATQTQFLFN